MRYKPLVLLILCTLSCGAPPVANSANPTPAVPVYALTVSDVSPLDCKQVNASEGQAIVVECANVYAGTYRKLVVRDDGSTADYRISVPWRPSPTPTPVPTPRPTLTPFRGGI